MSENQTVLQKSVLSINKIDKMTENFNQFSYKTEGFVRTVPKGLKTCKFLT